MPKRSGLAFIPHVGEVAPGSSCRIQIDFAPQMDDELAEVGERFRGGEVNGPGGGEVNGRPGVVLGGQLVVVGVVGSIGWCQPCG